MLNISYLMFWLMLLFLTMSRVKDRPENFKKILNSTKHPETLVFDVSATFQHEPYADQSTFSRVGTNNKKFPHTSAIVYYSQELEKNGSCMSQFCRFIQDYPMVDNDKMTLLFESNEQVQFDPQTHLPPKSDRDPANINSQVTVVFHLDPNIFKNQFCDKAKQLKSLITNFKSFWINYKTALQYNANSNLDISPQNSSNDIATCLRPILVQVDFLILNVEISHDTFILTYSKFKETLRKLLDPSSDIMRKSDSSCKIYAKIYFAGESGRGEMRPRYEISRRYYYYLLQFSIFWMDDGQEEGIILKGFNASSESGWYNGIDKLKQLVAPHIFSSIGGLPGWDEPCVLMSMMDHISSHFQTVSLDKDGLKTLERARKCTGSASQNGSRRVIPLQNIILRHDVTPPARNSMDELLNLSSIIRGLPVKLIEFHLAEAKLSVRNGKLFMAGLTKEDLDNLKSGIRELPGNIELACGFDSMTKTGELVFHKSFSAKVQQKCQYIWDKAKTIVWKFCFAGMSLETLTETLIAVEARRQEFIGLYPGKSIIIRASVGKSYTWTPPPGFGFFCDQNITDVYQRADVAMNFAQIHNFKIIIDLDIPFGWGSQIGVMDTVNTSLVSMDAIVGRNFPERFLAGEFPTNSCVTWPTAEPKTEMDIGQEYSGVMLSMGELKHPSAALAESELEILLKFTFHKFSFLELIPSSVTDMESILHVLSNGEFSQKLVIPKNKRAKIHLRIDCRLFTRAEIDNFLHRTKGLALALKPSGIHFVNWEDFPVNYLFGRDSFKSSHVMTGYSIGDCVHELNTNFSNFRKLRLGQKLNYLVCDLKYPAHRKLYSSELAKYLDTHLYINKYFRQQFPGKMCEIYFRHVHGTRATLEGSETGVPSFLKYASVVNQYVGIHKLKCLLFPSFDDAPQSKMGWWRISNATDLANISVFAEREAEFLKRETWRPSPSSENDMGTESGHILIISMSLIAAILGTIGIAILVTVCCKQRPPVPTLTSEEVEGFRFGTFVDCAGEEQPFDTRSFPDEFEISRDRFILLNLIGKGNFGLVYKSTLSIADDESIHVAVKMPPPNCTKESFKSMLSELKILCYIGGHPNVIGFVGAYINEIGRGIAYIATELCENGALQEFLRKLQTRDEHKDDVRLSSKLMSDLVRFAHEISLGMEYISGRKVVHGDLSTRNILLDSELQCKIGDFGLSRKLYNYEPYMKSEKCALPIRWLAIESLKRREFTTKSDVWSYGVTLWEIFSLGSVPYPGIWMTREFVEDLENGLRMSAPGYSTSDIYQEMTTCWHSNPEQRPTFEQLAESFAKIRNLEYAEI